MDALTKLAVKTDSATIINGHGEEVSVLNADTQTEVEPRIVIDLTVPKEPELPKPGKKWPKNDVDNMLPYNELLLINDLLKERTVRTDELLTHEFQVLTQRIDKLENTIKTDNEPLNMLKKPVMKQVVDECLLDLLPIQLKDLLGECSTPNVNNEELLSETEKKEVLSLFDYSTRADSLVQENKETQGNMATECVAKSYNEKSVSPKEKQPLGKAEVKAREDEQVEKNTGAKKKDVLTDVKQKDATKLKKQGDSSDPLEEERTTGIYTLFNMEYGQKLLDNPDLPKNRSPQECQRYYEHRQNLVNLLAFKKSEFSLKLNDRVGFIAPTYNYHAKYNPNISVEEQ